MRWAGLVEIVPGLVDEVANIVVARSVDGEGEDLSRDGDRPDGVAIRSVEEVAERTASSKRQCRSGQLSRTCRGAAAGSRVRSDTHW